MYRRKNIEPLKFIEKSEPKFKKRIIEVVETLPNEVFSDITQQIFPYVFDYYQISNHGRVYHKRLGKFLKPSLSGSGYPFVELSTEYGPKPALIHRLVMLTFHFIPNSYMMQVNYCNGIKTENSDFNLEWVSCSENIQHAYDTGLSKKGIESVHSTISEIQVINICKLLSEGYKIKDISSMLNVSTSIIASIKRRESWIDYSRKYEFNSRIGKLLSDKMVQNLCLYFETHDIGKLTINDFCRQALEYYNYDSSDRFVDSVRKIYNRKHYTCISCNYDF